MSDPPSQGYGGQAQDGATATAPRPQTEHGAPEMSELDARATRPYRALTGPTLT